MSNKASTALTVAAFALLVLSIHAFHGRLLDSLKEGDLQSYALLPPPSAVKLVSLGFDKLLADCYWLAFVGYVGDGRARMQDHYALADRYIDLIVSLDPKFIQAYWFAAFTVGSDQKRPDRAHELIERGIEANPDNWYLPFIAGINQYLFKKDLTRAAKYYKMASKYPGSPDWLARQAQILEAKIPAIIKRINIWNDIYKSADNEKLEEKAREKLIRLWVRVYKAAPSGEIKRRSARELGKLGVDLGMFSRVDAKP